MITKELINQSIDYMLRHLDDEITVKDVAAHIHYSEYHFSRTFKSITGESVYAFIKHLKMDQSAIDLKLKETKLLPILVWTMVTALLIIVHPLNCIIVNPH